ncbi:hypothetical protein Dimus_017171 [Dionaea muscipula]
MRYACNSTKLRVFSRGKELGEEMEPLAMLTASSAPARARTAKKGKKFKRFSCPVTLRSDILPPLPPYSVSDSPATCLQSLANPSLSSLYPLFQALKFQLHTLSVRKTKIRDKFQPTNIQGFLGMQDNYI